MNNDKHYRCDFANNNILDKKEFGNVYFGFIINLPSDNTGLILLLNYVEILYRDSFFDDSRIVFEIKECPTTNIEMTNTLEYFKSKSVNYIIGGCDSKDFGFYREQTVELKMNFLYFYIGINVGEYCESDM